MVFRPPGLGGSGRAGPGPPDLRGARAGGTGGSWVAAGPSQPAAAPPSPSAAARGSGLCRSRRPICTGKVRVCSARCLILLPFLLLLCRRTRRSPGLPALLRRAAAVFREASAPKEGHLAAIPGPGRAQPRLLVLRSSRAACAAFPHLAMGPSPAGPQPRCCRPWPGSAGWSLQPGSGARHRLAVSAARPLLQG